MKRGLVFTKIMLHAVHSSNIWQINIQSSVFFYFRSNGQIFSPLVFLYLVVPFRSNDPVSTSPYKQNHHNSFLNTNLPTVKLLTKEIRAYFAKIRIGNVKRAAAGPNGNLWRAVKKAKNLVHDEIPSNLTLGGGGRQQLSVMLPIVLPSILVIK